MTASNSSDRRELIVVTGASTGMGAATARELARRGFHVLAGVRRDTDADALRGDGIEPHILDITVESDVAAIAERVENDPQGLPLRALINNAGVAINAPVEALPIAEWRRQFEVNLFGHVAMIQALMPSLLTQFGNRRQHQFDRWEGGVTDVPGAMPVPSSRWRHSATRCVARSAG